MTPGVVANVREAISSSLRSWIIESLEHFGVDSLVFLHVIQSILEQDVRSLRGEDGADDLWRGRLTSNVGSKRGGGGGGGRDPKRQMNKDDLRRCVLLENMRACFKEDEFDAAEEFVDELLHRWTQEAQLNVAANVGMKNSSQDLREEMDDEENKETKDPVREYNEAFPALGTSPRTSPANPDDASEMTGRQNRNCGELLKELFYLNASSRQPRNDVCPTESSLHRSSTERTKCCREVAKSMARDFVKSRVFANTQQNVDSVRLLRSNELLECTNVVPDLSRRFFADGLRATNVRVTADRVVGSELAAGDPCARSSMPSLQTDCVQELHSHLMEMSNNTQGEGSKFFPPLPPGVLSRTVERILSQSLQGLPCCHVQPYGGGASCGCVQGSGRALDFPIYTENEFGMLIRLGEDCSRVADERTNQKSYGERVNDDASQMGVVGVGKDAVWVSSDNLPLVGTKDRIEAEEMDDLSVSRSLLGQVFPGQHSSEVQRGLQTHGTAVSGLKGANQFVQSSIHQADPWQGDGNESHDATVAGTKEALLRRNSCHRQFLTGKTQPSGMPVASSHSQTVGAIGSATALQRKPSGRNDFQASQWSETTASEVGLGLTDASLIGMTRQTQTNIAISNNAELSSSATLPLSRLGNDGALASSRAGHDEKDSSSSSAASSSCHVVLRLLADVIERDLMNHIAASLIPLFPDLSAPHDLYLPDAEMLAHIAVQNCILQPNRADAALITDAAFCGGMCENDYALYLHLAVREENLHVDHVLNFQDFCVWRRCLLQQVVSGKNVSCICDLCHRALKLLADSRYAFADADAARPSEASDGRPVADSERESLLVAESEHKELQSERHGPDKRDDFGSHFSSQPPIVTNICVQHSSAGTGDFTGKFDDIMTNKVPFPGKDGNYGTYSSVGEGDVLPQKLNDYAGVFGRSSLREIWPDGDADRKSDERWCGLKEVVEEDGDFEEENNNNLQSSFGCFSWPLSQGVALGNSVDIWLSSGTSLPSATSCQKVLSTAKSCDKTVLPDIASDENVSTAIKYNSAGHAYDPAANVCDKVASADAIGNKSANMCNRPVLQTGFCDQSALVTNSFGESFSTAASCSNWFCTDIAETVSASSISLTTTVSPSESKLECLSPSIRTLERLLSSDESVSSVQSFRSALHEDFYSLWLNTSPTHGHGQESSGPLCAADTSSDCGSQSLGSDDDDDAMRNDRGVHYEADISSSDSSVDDGSCLRDKALPSEADVLFGLSFSIPSQPSSSFALVGIDDDVISTNHSKFPSSQSSFDSSDVTDDRSDVSKPYSADCNSCSGEHLPTGTEDCKGLLLDWDLRRPHLESYEGQAAECFKTESDDLEEPTLYRTWEECSSENFGRVIPALDVNLPDHESLRGLTFSFDQQEAVDLEKFEKLKSIWNVSQLDNSEDLSADGKPQESGSANIFNDGSFSKSFSQLKDVKGHLPGSDLEYSTSDDYRKLKILWDIDQSKVGGYDQSKVGGYDQSKVGGYNGGTAALWENSDLESLREPAPIWNQHGPKFEHVSGITPDWNGNEHAPENSNVVWNERESQTDGARSGVLNWNVLHRPNADSCTDLTSCWIQQQNKVDNLEGPTLGCEIMRSDSENFRELTDECDDVGKADNFVASTWDGKKKRMEYLKGAEREVNANIEGEHSVAYVMDGNQQVSDSGNLKNLSHLKSLWEKEVVPHVVSSNILKVAWGMSHLGADCADGLTAHQTAELGSCKDLRELKSIWDEKEPCLAGSKDVAQNWELNQMGGKLRNPAEVQQVWTGNQMVEEETAANSFQQEPDSSNIQNLLELRFIWEDESPQKSDNFNGVVLCGNAESISLQKSESSSDDNQLDVGNLLEPGVAGNDHQAAILRSSEDVGFTWKVDEDTGGLTSTWDQQQPETDDIVFVGPKSGPLHTATDLENCMLLTSIWERRPSDSGKSSGWEVLESRSEGKAVETNLSNSNANHRLAVAECAGNDAGDFLNRAQTLRNEKQKTLESLMGAIWEMNGNDREGGVEDEEEVAYKCHPHGSDTETYQDLAQLESLWEEGESDMENLRSVKLNWDLEPSEEKNLMKLAADKDQEDVDANSFQNLKSIWDEKLPDSENDDVKGLMLDWDVNETDAPQYPTRLSSDDDDQQETEQGNFQNLAQLKSIWDEKKPDLEGSNLKWDINNRMETTQPSHPSQQESDPGNFLNLVEVKSIWEGKQSSSESLEKLASCWENPAPELENIGWERGDDSQQTSGNLMMVDSGIVQQDNECRNLQSVWKGQQPNIGNFKGLPSSCWTQQAVESEVLNTATSNWNMTHHLSSESFDNSLFDLNCRKLESENFECVDIKQSNSEIFLDRKLPEEKCFRRPTSDREMRYQEFVGIGASLSLSSSNVDPWQSDSDELKEMISRWDKQQTESRGIRGLFSHFDSQQQQSNLAAEWQLAEAIDQLKASDDVSASGLWRLAGRNDDVSGLPKLLVPSENSAFQDEIPRRFVYRYAFFDPRDVRPGCDLATGKGDARTETIRHIYEPSNSIVRQLEDLFDDGQRLQTEDASSLLLTNNLPNCLFRPIGEQNSCSGRDSYQSVAASVGLAGDHAGDLSLQMKSPSDTDPLEELLEPNSPYQLYLGVESQTFVPRFRVHKELEKSAQTGEATPPMTQNNECVFGMNVILSTIALLE